MKIGIMQPYLFPYIGYWQLLNAVDKFVVYDDVNYIKNGWINRNNILLNSSKYLFTVPLIKSSSFSLIKDIQVTDNIKAKEKLLKTFEAAYSKAPYYQNVMPLIKKVITNNGSISVTIIDSIQYICKYLNIETQILISSNLEKNNLLKSEEKVIEIVKKLNGNIYINAIGGQDLYNKDNFKNQGIDLKFIKTNEIIYKQFRNEFINNLSIIDVMMFNSPETIKEMLDDFILL